MATRLWEARPLYSVRAVVELGEFWQRLRLIVRNRLQLQLRRRTHIHGEGSTRGNRCGLVRGCGAENGDNRTDDYLQEGRRSALESDVLTDSIRASIG